MLAMMSSADWVQIGNFPPRTKCANHFKFTGKKETPKN